MGFWSKIFGKKKRQESSEENWENIVYERDQVDFREKEQRSGWRAVIGDEFTKENI